MHCPDLGWKGETPVQLGFPKALSRVGQFMELRRSGIHCLAAVPTPLPPALRRSPGRGRALCLPNPGGGRTMHCPDLGWKGAGSDELGREGRCVCLVRAGAGDGSGERGLGRRSTCPDRVFGGDGPGDWGGKAMRRRNIFRPGGEEWRGKKEERKAERNFQKPLAFPRKIC